jgi:hypothetical protein
MHSDDDRALHDHPWSNLSILLWGTYIEHTPTGKKTRRTGAIHFRRGDAAHRIEVDKPVWTLFITGPKYREWGFYCPQGWKHWKLFTDQTGNKSGKGCND